MHLIRTLPTKSKPQLPREKCFLKKKKRGEKCLKKEKKKNIEKKSNIGNFDLIKEKECKLKKEK
jgi:hypothetical protein